MSCKLWPFEGTKLLWGAVMVNSIFIGMAHWFANTVLNVMEDVIVDFLNESLAETHGLTLDANSLSYVYSIGVVSIWSAGAVFGGAIAHAIVERIGRRNCLMVFYSILNLSAGFLCVLAQWTYIPG